jgi:hypothetical protein
MRKLHRNLLLVSIYLLRIEQPLLDRRLRGTAGSDARQFVVGHVARAPELPGVRRVTQNPTQDWLSRQMTEAFPWDTTPRYVNAGAKMHRLAGAKIHQ